MPMQYWDSARWLSHLLPTQPPQRRLSASIQHTLAMTEPSGTSATASPGNNLSGVLFNALIVVSIVLVVGLLFFCLCSWCKLMAGQLCCCCPAVDDDDEESGVEVRDRYGRRRRSQRLRSRRHQVAPARRSTPSWLTGRAIEGRYPTPPPSYLESVDQLGMPPTPPPGYLTARQAAVSVVPAAPTMSVDPAAVRPLPVIVVDEDGDDKPAEDSAAMARQTNHRSCPNIRLVAPAPARSINDLAAPDG